ncbi:MAG: methyltransferase domain-containing protein [Spirochaetes bacterium]|nr:methyltransferase domain-containing protein [Spirochaetota bacterium]
MDQRSADVKRFIEYNYENKYFIEPEVREKFMLTSVLEKINLHNPHTVLKIGIGSEKLLFEIVSLVKKLVVVEYSFTVIQNFLEKHKDDPILKQIYIVNGDPSKLPVDYNIVDMILCIDCLDFVESARAIDEMKRVLDFEKVIVIGSIVLHADDLEGAMDEYYRTVNILHNDYYLPEDMNTMMKVKNFSLVQSTVFKYARNLAEIKKHMSEIFSENDSEKADNIISSYHGDFEKFYNLDESMNFEENYIICSYRKNFPSKEKQAGSLV